MNFNEPIDDDVAEDEIDDMMTAGTPVEIVPEKPKGDFVRTLGDQKVWFKTPAPGQFHAWQRYRESIQKRFDKVKKKAREEPSLETLRVLSDLSEKYDMAVIEFVESLMVDEDDKDFVALQMINGSVHVNDLMKVLFAEPEDDDTPPAPKPAKAPKKSAANAKRTKR